MNGGGPHPGTAVPHAVRAAARPLAIVLVDVTAALAALDDAERSTPRLSGDQVARFTDLISRGNTEAHAWRAAHIALRIVLERTAGTAVRGVCYTFEPGGRPRLPASGALPHPPHFSLSHTGGLALIAVAAHEPVGIDLECPRTVRIAPERRQRIEDAARLLVPAVPLPAEADDRFLQAWVRLEAAAKATGEGIGRVLTKAGAVGAGFAARDALGGRDHIQGSVAAADLQLGPQRFAAIAARTLPPVLLVEDLPCDAAGLAKFL